MILGKNSKFLSSLLFFEKGLDMYLYDVGSKKKEGFLDYKMSFRHFSKGVNPWFSSKIRNFFRVYFSFKKA